MVIAGPTGGGETSLMNLLLRVDEIDKGCVDIRDLTRGALRTYFGMARSWKPD